MTYTDEELFASARNDAFEGLIKVVSTREHPELRDTIQPHFAAIMTAIDEAVL